MMTLKESKAYIKEMGLKSKKDYLNYWYANKQECMRIGLPLHPDKYYMVKKLPQVEFNDNLDVLDDRVTEMLRQLLELERLFEEYQKNGNK